MQRCEQIRVLEGLMRHLDHDSNVDAGGQIRNPMSAYTDPDRAALEWREMFQNYPQVLGLSADLPGQGSFFTNNDLDRPILCHGLLFVCANPNAPFDIDVLLGDLGLELAHWQFDKVERLITVTVRCTIRLNATIA